MKDMKDMKDKKRVARHQLKIDEVKAFVKQHPKLWMAAYARHFKVSQVGMNLFMKRHGIKVKKYQFPIDELWDFVLANPHLKIEDYACQFNITYNAMRLRLKQLGLKPHITWKKENKNG